MLQLCLRKAISRTQSIPKQTWFGIGITLLLWWIFMNYTRWPAVQEKSEILTVLATGAPNTFTEIMSREGWPYWLLLFSNIDGGSPQLLMNTTSNDNHWLKLTLEGTESNRDAVGAVVRIERSDGHHITQQVKAGASYQSTSTKSLFFGLGSADILSMTIEWPTGETQLFENVPIDTTLHIVEDLSSLTEYVD